jgi:hypothetical protein
MSRVAAFRFSAVKDSYAQKKYGDATNVGVIGIAISPSAAPIRSRG